MQHIKIVLKSSKTKSDIRINKIICSHTRQNIEKCRQRNTKKQHLKYNFARNRVRHKATQNGFDIARQEINKRNVENTKM